MRFETDRFVIRKLRLDDFEDFYDMQSSENVMRYIKAPLDHDESKAELEKFIGYYSDDKRYFHLWAIVSKTNEDFVGICGVLRGLFHIVLMIWEWIELWLRLMKGILGR